MAKAATDVMQSIIFSAVRDRVAARPRIKAYLASDKRIAFNEHGIFRRYKPLDR